eukprot:Mrub_11862.p1 GENE.Mrub_11862~~Mrub_11862.p1  ORF type:complete len:150 (+),score=32.99 Mrub_11862:64-450(+)
MRQRKSVQIDKSHLPVISNEEINFDDYMCMKQRKSVDYQKSPLFYKINESNKNNNPNKKLARFFTKEYGYVTVREFEKDKFEYNTEYNMLTFQCSDYDSSLISQSDDNDMDKLVNEMCSEDESIDSDE